MNIDKDIERVKQKIKSLNLHIDNYYKKDCETAICRELISERDTLENLLSELSNLKWKNEIYVKSIKSHKETIEKKDIELETYKKIAEKLADKLVEIEDGCKHIPTEICNEYSNGRCKQCIIDWARKEVEEDE